MLVLQLKVNLKFLSKNIRLIMENIEKKVKITIVNIFQQQKLKNIVRELVAEFLQPKMLFVLIQKIILHMQANFLISEHAICVATWNSRYKW